MNILVILKEFADDSIKNNTRFNSLSQLSDDLYVSENKLYLIDEYESLYELTLDLVIDLIEDNIQFNKE